MTDGPGANDASAATSDPWLVKAHILVVDDEPGMRNFLVRTLAPRCARVEAVGDTVAAGRLIEALKLIRGLYAAEAALMAAPSAAPAPVGAAAPVLRVPPVVSPVHPA